MGRKHASMFVFKSFFTDLLNSFEANQENKGKDRKWGRKLVTEENRILHNINNPSFIVALNCIVLHLFLFLPQSLQRC